jgi:hypothetical protein
LPYEQTGINGNPGRPEAFSILRNYPNPFNGATRIELELAQPGHVELGVVNILGERVDDIYKGDLRPGRHSFIWDGHTGPMNMPVVSGPYILVAHVNRFTIAKKILILK